MLNTGKLAAGRDAGRYYVDTLAQAREDYYYTGEDDAQGEWMGGGAALLELTGQVGEAPTSWLSSATPIRAWAPMGTDVPSDPVGERASNEPENDESPADIRGFRGWARRVSNLRPLACEASALPLSYAPQGAT